MARVKKRRQRAPREQKGEVQKVAGTGPERFTVERFLHGIGDAVAKHLTLVSLSSGYQLSVKKMHPQTLPAMLILACYSRYYVDVELVDDYDRLIDDYLQNVPECAHPDKFMASCICILHPREQYPSYEAFEAIGMPALFPQLVNLEE